MEYKEYREDEAHTELLQASFIDQKDYERIHEQTVIVCHDVFIRTTYKDTQGILLVKRLNHPAKDVYWPIGGRILRGLSVEESLQKKSFDECSLTLSNIEYLGTARTFFTTEPFGHAKGTDTLNLVYIADGKGDLSLNTVHEDPLIITRENYTELKPSLTQYVQDFFDHIHENNLW